MAIKTCTCDHAYQDSKHGAGKRVHNETKKTIGTSTAWRCTVCGSERT
jgi:hypothetical protein